MLDSPIRKRAKNYPKDFTPPAGYFNTKQYPQSQPRNSNHQFIEKNNNNRMPRFKFQPALISISTQLLQRQPHSLQSPSPVNITINPEENSRFFYNNNQEGEKQSPLVNLHVGCGRKKIHINPEVLSRPRIQDNQGLQLFQKQEQIIQESTPGSIRKNSSMQKPLPIQKPNYVAQVQTKQAFSSKKVQSNLNIFNQSVKQQYLNFQKMKSKKMSTFIRSGGSQPQGTFKLAKRNSSPQIIETQTHNLFTTRRNEQQKNNQFMQYGYLLQQRKIDKIKAHINQIAFQKIKNKQKVCITNETQQDIYQQQKPYINVRPNTNFNFGQVSFRQQNSFPQLGDTQHQHTQRKLSFGLRNYHDIKEDANVRTFSMPKNRSTGNNPHKKIIVSYKKTSLNQLKQIYSTISRLSSVNLQISVPHALMNLNLPTSLQKSELYSQCSKIFVALGISLDNLTVKRYSNCILMVTKNICILWNHKDGKIYLGQWHTKYLDEGFKHGLGLEWVPECYVYYGQFSQGKKEGLGIMKMKNQTYAGEWIRGKKGNNGYVIDRNGNVIGGVRQGANKNQSQNEGQSDPFL